MVLDFGIGVRKVVWIRLISLVVPGVRGVVLGSFFEESVSTFDGFVGAIGEPCGFTCEQLLSDQTVIDHIETKL